MRPWRLTRRARVEMEAALMALRVDLVDGGNKSPDFPTGRAHRGECRKEGETMTTYRIAGHGNMGRTISEAFTSRAAAVRAAKYSLGYGARKVGVASRWPDGSIAIYDSRADLARDKTGEHAAYLVRDVSADEDA